MKVSEVINASVREINAITGDWADSAVQSSAQTVNKVMAVLKEKELAESPSDQLISFYSVTFNLKISKTTP